MESIDPVQGEWKEEMGRGMRRSTGLLDRGEKGEREGERREGGECWEANQRLRR